mgnify:CR=1 FL=1
MRRRIVLLALVTAGLALLLFGAPLAVGLVQFAFTEERIGLQRLADSTAWTVQDRLSHGEVPASLPAAPGDVTVALYDADGVRLAGEGPARIDRPVRPAPEEGIQDHDDLVVVSPVSDTHHLVGVVRVAGDPQALYAALIPWWAGMSLLAGAVLTAVWLLARRQARRLSRPLEVLAMDAERLGNGDFGVRSAAAGVDEVDHVVQALDTTARRLDGMLARERAFSAEASHQLRTPLTGLRLRLEAAVDGPDDAVRDAVALGLTSIDRLEQTIDDLLRLARERREHQGATDLAVLLSDAEREWSDSLAADGRVLEIRVGHNPPPVATSEEATRQVLGVLLDNASKHGAGHVRIGVREIDESALAVDVTDEGGGVTPEMLNVTEHRSGAGGGRGMGLPLAQRLVAAEGGRLVAGEPGTVSLLLPVAVPSGLPDAPAQVPSGGATSRGRAMTSNTATTVLGPAG